MRRATQLLSRAAIMTRAASRDRRATSSAPVGLAPDPAATPEAVVQVYGARCSGWLGYFGVHTWIAVKPAGARAYTIYEVLDWRLRRSGSVVAIRKRVPDARWAGSAPEILANKRGDGVDALIERIDKAVREYPYAHEYVVWPGPNSNTFTAYVARAVPELGLLGVLASGVEGFEVNLLGLTFGIDPFSPALRLPLIGRFGAVRSNGAGTPVSIPAGPA